MKKLFTACLILLSNIHASFAETNNCLRCHQMETLAYRDTVTNQIVNLYVSPQHYQKSNHKHLECTECHTADYSPYPHPKSVKQENLYCLDCHKNDIPYSFSNIEHELKNSVHAKQLNCFSCHDPHQFKISRVGDDIGQIVQNDNKICLNCHTSPDHQWLPNPLLHWRSVRCIDCH
ncbi:MAG: cytochrome c3 family protein, partial [Thiotrichaceae bacterium]|nr:cytochrome c3 family protein [Thiotrichaceae bacterium]